MIHVDILCSDPQHGVNAWLERWVAGLAPEVDARIHRTTATLRGGDFLFLVSCHQIIGAVVRERFRHSLVLHCSDLPRGRGMSPHVWQILEGQRHLTLTLLEAAQALDAGRIWHRLQFEVPDNAVCAEINQRLFEAEIALMDWALANCDHRSPSEQSGEPSYYRKRSPADSRIDPEQTLADAFDLLRVSDPDRYPAFFEHRGRRYRLRLEPM